MLGSKNKSFINDFIYFIRMTSTYEGGSPLYIVRWETTGTIAKS
jgi:hypothetical protein